MQRDQNTLSVFDRLDVYRNLPSAKRMMILEIQAYTLEHLREQAQEAEDSSLKEVVLRWLKAFREFEASITRDYR